MIWLTDVISNFFCATNVVDNCVKVSGLAVVVWGIIKADNVFKMYESKRYDAMWSFYVNLNTFLYLLELTIGCKSNPSPVTDYFYKQMENNASEKDKKEIENFQKLSSDFLYYLSTSGGQIPPSNDFDNWKKLRLELITFLHKALSLGLKIGIEKNNLQSALQEIHQVIECMKKEIASFENKVKEREIFDFKQISVPS